MADFATARVTASGDFPLRADGNARRALSDDEHRALLGDARPALSGDARPALSGDARPALSGDARPALSGDARRAISGDSPSGEFFDRAQVVRSDLGTPSYAFEFDTKITVG